MRPETMFAVQSLLDGETISLPNPDADSALNTISTLVNAGRNASAVVTAQKIGRDQEKTELKWDYLEKDKWERLLRFWDKNFFFSFIYYNRVRGTKITRKFYIGDRTDRPFTIGYDGTPVAYLDCNANVIDTGGSA